VDDITKLEWEAPIKNQQQFLIQRFGVNVNLGNVPPEDILALEALRNGLRGDTLKEAFKKNPTYKK
jgi:phosphosulfolactate synthase